MTEIAVTKPGAYHVTPGSNADPTRLVIHTTESGGYPKASSSGTAQNVAEYFAGKDSGGSAHYIVDLTTTLHPLSDATIGWHAPPNPHTLGIEICGTAAYTKEQWLSDSVWPAVKRAAVVATEVCKRLSIPVVRRTADEIKDGAHGICGHVDVSNAFHESTHTDPGPNFPWDEFMALLAPAPVKTKPTAKYVLKRTLQHGNTGADVGMVQRLVGCTVDDAFGPDTEAHVKHWQRAKGLSDDGIFGPRSARVAGWSYTGS